MKYRQWVIVALVVSGLFAVGRMVSRAEVAASRPAAAGSAWAEEFIAKMDGEKNAMVWKRLDEHIREISSDQQPLEKVINFLQDNAKASFFVNWSALTTAGIDRNSPVTMNMHDMPFGKVLTTTLNEACGGHEQLSYTVDDGVIVISTRDDLAGPRYMTTQVYDLSDLMPKTLGPEQRARRYIDTINSINVAITPTGCKLGCMAMFEDQLVVTQTRVNHVAIARLLGKLRDRQQ